MNSWRDYYDAALRGGSYTNAALAGAGSYTNAALEGAGSYTSAALDGCGKPRLSTRVRKGSPEAKARMAYLRSLRKTRAGESLHHALGFNPPPSAMGVHPYHQAMIKKMLDRERMKERKKMKGGLGLEQILSYGLKGTLNSIGDWVNTSRSMKDELKRLRELKKAKGGKFTFHDFMKIITTPGGPVIGAIRVGVEKKREKEIEKLRKELGEDA